MSSPPARTAASARVVSSVAAAACAAACMAGVVRAERPQSVVAAGASAPYGPNAIAQACSLEGWVKVQGTPNSITSVAASPEFEFLFAGSLAPGTDHLWRGAADDRAWAAVPDLSNILITAIAVGPGTDPAVWVGERGGGVYASDTGGSSFRFGGLANSSITALLPITSTVLAAASEPTRRGVYGWDAVASAWVLRGGSTIASPVLYALAADSLGSLWLGTESTGLWRSDDAGRNWTQVGVGGSTNSTVIAVAPDPTAALRIYIGHGIPRKNPPAPTEVRGAHVTQNGGVSWAPVLTEIQNVTAIAPLSSIPGAAYAAGWGRGLLHTVDGGLSWHGVPGAVDAVSGDASQHLEALTAVRPRGTVGCEVLLAGGADGLWARNVARTTYHSVYLPISHCGSAHCAALSAGAQGKAAAPLRFDVVPR